MTAARLLAVVGLILSLSGCGGHLGCLGDVRTAQGVICDQEAK